MLQFYGIRLDPQGRPERYKTAFDLRESLNACLHIHDYFRGDLKALKEAVQEEINQLYEGGLKHQPGFRHTVAKWMRVKDMAAFLQADPELYPLRLKLYQELNRTIPLDRKWQAIKPHLKAWLESRYDQQERLLELGMENSSLHQSLEFCVLLFLEQDEEVPPPNLEMQFVRGQFPKVIWKRKEGLNPKANPFWRPQNPHCNLTWLLADLQQESTPPALTSIPQGRPLQGFYPVGAPDSIRLALQGDLEEEQLSAIPESPVETLFGLQKMIQRRFSHAGVKHFLAIFRQLAENSHLGQVSFKTGRHLDLVSRKNAQGKVSEPQSHLMQEVLDCLKKLQVIRQWSQGQEVCNPLLVEIGQSQTPQDLELQFLLDPLFLPHPDNPYRLGQHLCFLPEGVFLESTRNHALVPSLVSYFTGCWLNEFPQTGGTTCRTAEEIIQGCAFNLNAANRYKILDKLRLEMDYLEEQDYVSRLACTKDQDGNPWKDSYQVTAPALLLRQLAQTGHQALTAQIS